MVSEIRPLGSPEHDTGNEADDVCVDFTAMDYSDKRKEEIADNMNLLCNRSRSFDELPLDNVVMLPDSLIRITGIDLPILANLIENRETAEIFCNQVLAGEDM
jgi:hypothetical protein